tara:strand:+ start:4917 stop:6173 length:1257 start_codon:yes stop_codon:yes gene_type:complete
VDDIETQRTAGQVPLSGSVDFYLRMGNAKHTQTTPVKFTLNVAPISRSWDEGYGLDMENYTDLGFSNWISASASSSLDDGGWVSEGGDYLSTFNYTQYFSDGVEDLEVNITPLVESWISGTTTNYGVGVHFTSSEETGDQSFYTKMFFARGSEFYYKRPYIEARWDSAITDDRNDFVLSSSLLPASDNLNKIYLYNKFRGRLVNIPEAGTGSIYVSMYSGTTAPVGTRLPLQGGVYVVTGGYVSAGIYSASVAMGTNLDQAFDVWHNDSGSTPTEYYTGSAITVRDHTASPTDAPGEYITTITNLKPKYATNETPRIKLYTRAKDWQPTVYTIATSIIENNTINNMFYQLTRVSDGYEVIPYGTGSLEYTKLSYDGNGNYFDFDMSLLQPGYEYSFKFLILEYDEYREQPEVFKFRVE